MNIHEGGQHPPDGERMAALAALAALPAVRGKETLCQGFDL